MEKELKVLVVDDTVTYRQILSNIVSELPEVNLIGTAPNGKIALEKVKINQPDLILLDISMPVMDGLETLKILKKDYPQIEVVIVSGMDKTNANLTVQALNLGALDFLPKPTEDKIEKNIESLHASIKPLISLVKTRKYLRFSKKKPDLQKELEKKKQEKPLFVSKLISKVDVIALGISTGGPNALQKVIPKLPGSLRVPILTVQHMPPNFTASLAERLNRDSEIEVFEAKAGQKIENGKMYIAPGGTHMVVRKNTTEGHIIGIIDSPPVNSCKPSVDVLFRSVAMTYESNILSVIMTGMGNDGAAGVLALKRKGAYSIIQDEKTSVVWGMPSAVVNANASDEILPLEKIAERITEIVDKGVG